MKRYCSIILILAMAVATFAGCKQDGASGKSQKVFFVKHFSLKKASEFPVFSEGFSLL